MLITDHDDWPAAEVIAGYRSQSEAEFSFRRMKDPRVVSFSPMWHWTEHNIRVHVFTCGLALQIAHLLRLQAERAGLHLSVRELLRQLAGIGETVLIYPAERGRPKARRMLTETTPVQDKLCWPTVSGAGKTTLDRLTGPVATPSTRLGEATRGVHGKKPAVHRRNTSDVTVMPSRNRDLQGKETEGGKSVAVERARDSDLP